MKQLRKSFWLRDETAKEKVLRYETALEKSSDWEMKQLVKKFWLRDETAREKFFRKKVHNAIIPTFCKGVCIAVQRHTVLSMNTTTLQVPYLSLRIPPLYRSLTWVYEYHQYTGPLLESKNTITIQVPNLSLWIPQLYRSLTWVYEYHHYTGPILESMNTTTIQVPYLTD